MKALKHRHARRCVAALLLGTCATVVQAHDDGTWLEWERIVGIIQPSGLVGWPSDGECNIGIDCFLGTPAPWSTTEGTAAVNLHYGDVRFVVKGLVVAGDPSFSNLGTTSVIRKVKGTVVCNDTAPGVPVFVDTPAVQLSKRGNAQFRGHLALPSSCLSEPNDVVFLIRIAEISGGPPLVDLWNAFGAVRRMTNTSQ